MYLHALLNLDAVQGVSELHRQLWAASTPMLLLGLAAAGLASSTATAAEERLNPGGPLTIVLHSQLHMTMTA